MFRTAKILLCSALICACASQPAHSQQVKHNPDGTVEVIDDAPQMSPRLINTHVSDAPGVAPAQASRTQKRTAAPAAGRKIPAYSKRQGDVTVKRHADGSIEVVDETEKAPARNGAAHTGTSYGNGQAITRHSDGSVEVRDTTMSSSAGGSTGSTRSGKKIGSYKKQYSDCSVKRNADGSIEVIDTSESTRKKR